VYEDAYQDSYNGADTRGFDEPVRGPRYAFYDNCEGRKGAAILGGFASPSVPAYYPDGSCRF
jgi:hypothetical protein